MSKENENRRKGLQDMAKEVIFLEAEWTDLNKKVRNLGTKLRAMARTIDNALDKES
jgi:hypothetical protein